MKLKILELAIHTFIIILLVLATTRPVGAQTASSPVVKEATSAVGIKEGIASNAAEKKPEYQLPYAGLLPDNPLYVLKAIRDRIIDFLIMDSLKKAEFTLLQADKRLATGIALVEKGKPDLAESTISKGENYLSRSIASLEKAKSEGKDTPALTNKLIASLEKHEQVLKELEEKTSGSLKDRFKNMAEKVSNQRESLQKE